MFLIITVAILISVYAFYILYTNNNKNSGQPPGPWNLPILGFLHKLDPAAPYLTLTQLSKKYGPIYRIKMGMTNAVVVSDAKLLKKIFIKDAALERPPLYIFKSIFEDKGLVCANGSLWKDQRRLVLNFLRAVGATKTSPNKELFQQKIQKNVESFINWLTCQGNCVALNPTEAITHYVTRTSSVLFLGESYKRNDEALKIMVHHIDQATTLSAVAGPVNFLPFLRFLPKYGNSTMLLKKSSDFIQNMARVNIDERIETFARNENAQYSLIDAFLLEKSKNTSEEMYNLDQLQHLIADMFGASTETTVNSLLWSILYLATYKEVQSKVRQELFDVLQGRAPLAADLLNLPYTQATLAEVARIRTIAPIAFPHYTSEDITIDGVKINKNTMIMPLLWAIHMDPKIWKNPEEFCPERFLNGGNKFYQPEAFLPFLVGKRMCVGEDLAKLLIFMFVSGVLQKFVIEGCDNGVADVSPTCGFTLVPKRQNVIFTKL